LYRNAVGFGSGSRLLGGLSTKGAAGQSAYGQAMAASAGLNMDRASQNQQFGVQQMQQRSDLAQSNARNQMSAYGNQIQERMKTREMDNRLGAFDTQMNWNYAGLNKQRQLNMQQALLGNLARDI
jgi:hypothetical protein